MPSFLPFFTVSNIVRPRVSYRRALLWLSVVAGGCLSSSAVLAQSCAGHERVVEVETATATASSWSNLRNNPGSLRFESARLLTRATGDNTAPPPADLSCPAGCSVPKAPEVLFVSVPQKYLSDYSEREHCEQLRQATTKKPFTYANRTFTDSSGLNDWFGDFSQGKGKDGKDLYSKCDGACSPQYTCEIRRDGKSGLVVNASVVCGAARDKDDNSYRLTLAYRWACKSDAETAKP